MSLSRREIMHFVIASLVLAIVFGFNDGSEKFDFSFWMANFILMLLFSAIALFINILGHKLMAKRLGASAKFELWSMKRFGLQTAQKTGNNIYIGAAIALVLSLFSQG